MSTQSDILQRNSFTPEDLEKLKQLMIERTMEMERSIIMSHQAQSKSQQKRLLHQHGFRTELDKMLYEN